jgi:hypothetical protein
MLMYLSHYKMLQYICILIINYKSIKFILITFPIYNIVHVFTPAQILSYENCIDIAYKYYNHMKLNTFQ